MDDFKKKPDFGGLNGGSFKKAGKIAVISAVIIAARFTVSARRSRP